MQKQIEPDIPDQISLEVAVSKVLKTLSRVPKELRLDVLDLALDATSQAQPVPIEEPA